MGKATIIRVRQSDGDWYVTGWRQNGVAWCPRCDAEVPLVEDVEGFYPDDGGVESWGPGQGVCEGCHLLMVDDWYSDRALVYDLSLALSMEGK